MLNTRGGGFNLSVNASTHGTVSFRRRNTPRPLFSKSFGFPNKSSFYCDGIPVAKGREIGFESRLCRGELRTKMELIKMKLHKLFQASLSGLQLTALGAASLLVL